MLGREGRIYSFKKQKFSVKQFQQIQVYEFRFMKKSNEKVK